MAKILTVDDEPDVLFLLKVTLELAGHTVEQAQHGAAALEMIATWRPDLIITDLMMPVMDGREFIEQLRARPDVAGIPVILLSAAPDVDIPAERIMRKPFLQGDLMNSIKELVPEVA